MGGKKSRWSLEENSETGKGRGGKRVQDRIDKGEIRMDKERGKIREKVEIGRRGRGSGATCRPAVSPFSTPIGEIGSTKPANVYMAIGL